LGEGDTEIVLKKRKPIYSIKKIVDQCVVKKFTTNAHKVYQNAEAHFCVLTG